MPEAPLHDWEDPDESDQDNPDSVDRGSMPCPHCGHEIDEDSTWCHACGELLTEKDRPRVTTTLLVIAVIIALAIVFLAIRAA
jgi:predicted nucleic acid-binding Zn ribbon protein